jgi:hypothetical protein
MGYLCFLAVLDSAVETSPEGSVLTHVAQTATSASSQADSGPLATLGSMADRLGH